MSYRANSARHISGSKGWREGATVERLGALWLSERKAELLLKSLLLKSLLPKSLLPKGMENNKRPHQQRSFHPLL